MAFSGVSNMMMLPKEMQLEILKHLPLEDKRSARLASKLWKDLADDLLLKFNVYLTEENLKYLEKFSNPVHTVTMGNSRTPLVLGVDYCRKLSEAKHLELSNHNPLRPTNPTLNCSENILLILRVCRNISELRITGEFLDSVILTFLTVPLEYHTATLFNLTSISINLDCVRGGFILKAFPKLKAPNLKNLEFSKGNVLLPMNMVIFSTMYFFIKAHEKILKTLKMNNTITNYNLQSERIAYFENAPPRWFGIRPLVHLQLESLEINHSVNSANCNWSLSQVILLNQRMLKTIKIEVMHIHLYRKLMELVRQNKELEKIEIDLRVFYASNGDPLTLDIEDFALCGNLRELRVFASPYFTVVNELRIPRSIKIFYWSGKLSHKQLGHLASQLMSVEHVTLNHVFANGLPGTFRRKSSQRFDVALLSLFKEIPSLITLKVSSCDIRTCLLSLINYCKRNQITIKKELTSIYSRDFPNCGKTTVTFTFPRV